MDFDVKFSVSDQSFNPQFGEVHNISDGGYERGYGEGYSKGEEDGYSEGHADGLAARTFETWTITYVDGTVEEKEVALL